MQAFRYIKSNGLASSDNYQYSGRESQCRKKGSTTIPITSAVRERLNGNENRLKQILATYGPVTVAINAAKSLTNYRSGVYTNPKCSKNLDHAVLLVGYGHDEKTKLDYWLVKNSWVRVRRHKLSRPRMMIRLVLLGNVVGRKWIRTDGPKQRINLWNCF